MTALTKLLSRKLMLVSYCQGDLSGLMTTLQTANVDKKQWCTGHIEMPGLTIVVPVQLLKAASNGAFHGNTLQLLASLVTL